MNDYQDQSHDTVKIKKLYYRFKSYTNPKLSFVVCCDLRCKKQHLDAILKKLFSSEDPRNIELFYSRENGQAVMFSEFKSHQIYYVNVKKKSVPTSLLEYEDIQNYNKEIVEVISEADYEQIRMNSVYELVSERLDKYTNLLSKNEHSMNRKVFDWQKVYREKTTKSQKILSELGQVLSHFTEIEEELLNINSGYTLLEKDIQKYLNKIHSKPNPSESTIREIIQNENIDTVPDDDDFHLIKVLSPTKKSNNYFA